MTVFVQHLDLPCLVESLVAEDVGPTAVVHEGFRQQLLQQAESPNSAKHHVQIRFASQEFGPPRDEPATVAAPAPRMSARRRRLHRSLGGRCLRGVRDDIPHALREGFVNGIGAFQNRNPEMMQSCGSSWNTAA